jgi:EpsI family protein
MAKLKFRYLIVIILMVITASAVNGLQYDVSLNDESGLEDIQAIPLQIGDFWQGQDFPLDEMVYEILETRAIIHRAFTGPQDENVFLSVVHYADTKLDFHAPEACLGGQGLKTTKTNKQISFLSGKQKTTLDVAEIVTTKTNGNSLTYYFYKSGKYAGSNYIRLRLSVAANKFTTNDTRASLVRISTDFSSGEKAEAESRLTVFLQDFFPYAQQIL